MLLSGANAPVFARACGGSLNANVPLTRRPVAVAPGSVTDRVASPAVLVTVAVVDASYVRSTPGVNGPNAAGAPSVSESVAGTVPPTPPSLLVPWMNVAAPEPTS